MRDLIVTQNITVDGVVEAGDWFGPADGGQEVLEALREQMAPPTWSTSTASSSTRL